MQKIISAIQALLGVSVATTNSPLSDIKRVFFGDPITIAESNLPALTIQPVGSDYLMRGSRYDQKTHNIEIRLVYNQKDYFLKNISAGKNITGAVFSSSSIVFECVGHELQAGDNIIISGISPEAFNGTFLVAGVTDDDHFSVSKQIDPGTYSSGGIVQKATVDKVFAIEDAIKKIEEMNTDHSTADLSVCGVIQSNPSLPYSDGGVIRNAAELAQIRSVNYTFNDNRGFPTFEVVVSVAVVVVGDR